MARTTSISSSSGVGFAGLLTIVFIVLKLTGVIAWSWVWVLAPLWVGAILFVAFFLLMLVLIIASQK